MGGGMGGTLWDLTNLLTFAYFSFSCKNLISRLGVTHFDLTHLLSFNFHVKISFQSGWVPTSKFNVVRYPSQIFKWCLVMIGWGGTHLKILSDAYFCLLLGGGGGTPESSDSCLRNTFTAPKIILISFKAQTSSTQHVQKLFKGSWKDTLNFIWL